METIPYHPLIHVTEEDVKKIREFYNLKDTKEISERLDALEEWCKKQDHLVDQNLDRIVLERIFLLSKASLEGAKRRVDNLFTSRGLMPELCLNRNLEEFENFWNHFNYVPLPKLCPTDQSRVMVTQFNEDSANDFNLLTYFRYCFLIGEYRLYNDYCLSERYIIDLKNVNLAYFSKLNPVVIKKAEVLCTEGFGTKIKGIHILHAPAFIDKFVFLLKQALKAKVASRIHIHHSYEDLHMEIPKKILPEDYDGDEQSVNKLAAQWRDELRTEDARGIITKLDKMITDESKRQTDKFNEEYLGMPGSFRTLSVD